MRPATATRARGGPQSVELFRVVQSATLWLNRRFFDSMYWQTLRTQPHALSDSSRRGLETAATAPSPVAFRLPRLYQLHLIDLHTSRRIADCVLTGESSDGNERVS